MRVKVCIMEGGYASDVNMYVSEGEGEYRCGVEQCVYVYQWEEGYCTQSVTKYVDWSEHKY